MNHRLRIAIVLVLVLAACGGASETTTTTSSSTDSDSGGVETTTTVPVTIETTTTAPPDTTTTEAVSDIDANAVVAAKTAAAEAVFDDDWTVTTGPTDEFDEGDDNVYELCPLADEFDLSNLDDVSAAALVTDFQGPSATPPFPGQSGSIEARVFNSEAEAAEAFAVFQRIFASQEGLECMTEAVTEILTADVPVEDFTFTIEEVIVAGSQTGARFGMTFDVSGFDGGFFIEFQGTRVDSWTVIASFLTFDEPFDRDIADAVFSAAVNA